MLETIKRCINDVPNISFAQFYSEYILTVQDNNIESEFQYMIHHNLLNTSMMDTIIQHTHERLIQICSATMNFNPLM